MGLNQLNSGLVYTNDECIGCNHCISVCPVFGPNYPFLDDLSKGESVSLLVAPAFIANYPREYGKVLGYLKSLGVKHIISVSFGADITTWGYLNYITKYKFQGGKSQPSWALYCQKI